MSRVTEPCDAHIFEAIRAMESPMNDRNRPISPYTTLSQALSCLRDTSVPKELSQAVENCRVHDGSTPAEFVGDFFDSKMYAYLQVLVASLKEDKTQTNFVVDNWEEDAVEDALLLHLPSLLGDVPLDIAVTTVRSLKSSIARDNYVGWKISHKSDGGTFLMEKEAHRAFFSEQPGLVANFANSRDSENRILLRLFRVSPSPLLKDAVLDILSASTKARVINLWVRHHGKPVASSKYIESHFIFSYDCMDTTVSVAQLLTGLTIESTGIDGPKPVVEVATVSTSMEKDNPAVLSDLDIYIHQLQHIVSPSLEYPFPSQEDREESDDSPAGLCGAELVRQARKEASLNRGVSSGQNDIFIQCIEELESLFDPTKSPRLEYCLASVPASADKDSLMATQESSTSEQESTNSQTTILRDISTILMVKRNRSRVLDDVRQLGVGKNAHDECVMQVQSVITSKHVIQEILQRCRSMQTYDECLEELLVKKNHDVSVRELGALAPTKASKKHVTPDISQHSLSMKTHDECLEEFVAKKNHDICVQDSVAKKDHDDCVHELEMVTGVKAMRNVMLDELNCKKSSRWVIQELMDQAESKKTMEACVQQLVVEAGFAKRVSNVDEISHVKTRRAASINAFPIHLDQKRLVHDLSGLQTAKASHSHYSDELTSRATHELTLDDMGSMDPDKTIFGYVLDELQQRSAACLLLRELRDRQTARQSFDHCIATLKTIQEYKAQMNDVVTELNTRFSAKRVVEELSIQFSTKTTFSMVLDELRVRNLHSECTSTIEDRGETCRSKVLVLHELTSKGAMDRVINDISNQEKAKNSLLLYPEELLVYYEDEIFVEEPEFCDEMDASFVSARCLALRDISMINSDDSDTEPESSEYFFDSQSAFHGAAFDDENHPRGGTGGKAPKKTDAKVAASHIHRHILHPSLLLSNMFQSFPDASQSTYDEPM